MKKRNSTSEFNAHRNTVLLENFRSAIANQSRIETVKAFQTAADMPAPRFWVSEQRAAVVISKMLAGEPLPEGTFEKKREMYEELCARVKEMRALEPDRTISSLVMEAVNSPAPSSYMSWQRAQALILEERARRHGR